MARVSVDGYCWPQSAAAGDTVSLHLSVSDPRPVRIEVARIGAGRTVLHTDTVEADHHPVPAGADVDGCGWPVATTFTVGDDWASGYYEVLLTVEDDKGRERSSHAFVVVRPNPTTTDATILLALATNTWHAYNDFGGRNLYTGGTTVALQRPMSRGLLHKPAGGVGRRVTSTNRDDRKMEAHVGYLALHRLTQWAGSAGWQDWEEKLLAWAEREGYRIDVVSNADLEDHPDLLGPDSPYRLYLSVGHDEYWSGPMRDTVEGFVARGGNAAFLSGNTSFWQVRLEDADDAGRATRMVGFKGQYQNDPVYGTDRQAELTTLWSDVLLERPENHLTGVSFSRGGYHRIGPRVTNGAGGYTVHRHDHWLFDDTGLTYGDVLGAASTVVGYECDGCAFTYVDGRPVPTGDDQTPDSFVILGTAPAAHFTRTEAPRPPADNEPSELEYIASRVFGDRDSTHRIEAGHAVLGTFTSPGGGTVVTSGSTDWAHGLVGTDPQIEQVTRNLLDRLG